MNSKDYDAFKDVLDEIDALKQDLTSGKRRELRGVDKVGKRMDLSRFNAAFATLRSRLPDESILAQYDSELRQVSRENATPGNLEKMESLIDSLQKSIGMAWITSDLSDTEYQELLGILSSKNVIDKVVLLNQGIDVHLTKAQANRLRALRIVRTVRGKPALEERGRILAKLASDKKSSVLMGARVSRPRSAKGTDSSFTIKEGKERLETKSFWAEFRVKKDERRGDQYIDVLIGRKDEMKPHSHIGINLDQSTRFVEPRGVLNTIRRVVNSKQMGRLADETIEYSERRDGKPEGNFVFQIIIDEPTKTITPRFEEAQLEEKTK